MDDLDLDQLARLPAEHVADNHRVRAEDMPWRAPFKAGAGHPPDAAVVVHVEFQSGSHPHMAERVIEYAVLLRRDLLRGGATLVPAHVPLVVYSGRAKWSPPLRVEERTAWVPDALAESQPRMAFRFVDAKAYRGDHVPDGNVARAWLALEAADAAGVAAALEHAARTFAGAGDAALSRGFAVWCRGVLPQRFGDRLRSLTDMMEKPTMLAERFRNGKSRNSTKAAWPGARRAAWPGARKNARGCVGWPSISTPPPQTRSTASSRPPTNSRSCDRRHCGGYRTRALLLSC